MNTFQLNISNLRQIRTKKLTYRGRTEDLPVYQVPISQLFYNDMNGRIATFISQYESDGKRISDLNNEEYNNKISEFIKASSTPERYKRTREDIRNNTQKEVGVVLTDGRVIDGNRRFTCLRDLFNETGDPKFEYFEAVVLPAPSMDDEQGWKAINSLELELQIGTDEKVDYSPIDWLVRVYRDLVKGDNYSPTEYCRLTGLTKTEYNTTKIKAELMEDFLEFFNKPEQFYIAKNLELDGPLTELVRLRKKLNDRDWNECKVVFYVYLWNTHKGDRTRRVRQLLKSVGTPSFAQLIEEANIEAEKILDPSYISKPKEKQTVNSFGELLKQQESETQSFEKKLVKTIDEKARIEARNKPIKCVEDALKHISDIDMDIVRRFDESQLIKFKRLINDLIKEAEKFNNGN